MSCTRTDLTIGSALSDPMIAAVMRADRVDPRHFEALLRSKARSLGWSRGETGVPPRMMQVGSGLASRGACAW